MSLSPERQYFFAMPSSNPKLRDSHPTMQVTVALDAGELDGPISGVDVSAIGFFKKDDSPLPYDSDNEEDQQQSGIKSKRQRTKGLAYIHTGGVISPNVEERTAVATPLLVASNEPQESGKKISQVEQEADEYYGGTEVWTRARTFSNAGTSDVRKRRPQQMNGQSIDRDRRLSHDVRSETAPRRFLLDVEKTTEMLLRREDSDQNYQITVADAGPKLLAVGTANSNAHRTVDIRGTYMLSSLLQELALARDFGRKRVIIDEARLTENPVERLSRMIRNTFWSNLTRRMDGDGMDAACADTKADGGEKRSRIYVPHDAEEQAEYYREMSIAKPELGLQVIVLPEHCDEPTYAKTLDEFPGMLALAMRKNIDPATEKPTLEAVPFIVPGARFNEMYYWDSYFMALGLLVDGRYELVMDIVEHCIFQIKHYNKVLNGNRTYYLCRSQPPFLTDLAVQVYNQHPDRESIKPWLKRAIKAAIKEYHSYWMAEPSLDTTTGLSRYRPAGWGVPPETEPTHFNHKLRPYADKLGISIVEFIDGYNKKIIIEPELDDYFMHDRGIRESGHDTSYRLENRCADIATVDLNSLLYKYESDIGSAIEEIFGGELVLEEEFNLAPWPITVESYAAEATREKSTSRVQTAREWRIRSETRRQTMTDLCWNEGQGLFFDYNTKTGKQTLYESITCLYPLWAGCATEDQALKLVRLGLPKFEMAGGLVAGTQESRGIISMDRPERQWDFPSGWPPHQITTWVGLQRYGFELEASRLAYRWVYMMTLTFVDFNGIVPEKFDVVEMSHTVDAEYGNQGTNFRYIPREGFGWMNASYQVGLQFLSTGMRRAVANCVPPWTYFKFPAPDFPAARQKRVEREAQALAAAEAGQGGEPEQRLHPEPPTLEQTIAALKIEFFE